MAAETRAQVIVVAGPSGSGKSRLCARLGLPTVNLDGVAEVPVYDISQDRRTGHRKLDIGEARYFLAEGIFAQEVVRACVSRGLLSRRSSPTPWSWAARR